MQSLVTAKGPILVDAPDKVSGLENLTLEPLVNAENEALWWGRDGEAVAKSLRARKVRYVLLHRAVTPSIDRNGAVLSRLYHDDFRQWFTLIGVDERLLMYRVLDAPYAFSLPLAHHTIRQIRTLVRGETAQALPEPKAEDGKKWNLILVARRPGGREIAVGMCYRESYRECVAELARDLVRSFLDAKFTGEERHRRRLGKLNAIEKRYGRAGSGPEEEAP
ncbi:MAG: hypothetical protein QGF68_08650 [Nitrospinota bacterium]|nr:hypothetical protein [Nitrospinota bacterium]